MKLYSLWYINFILIDIIIFIIFFILQMQHEILNNNNVSIENLRRKITFGRFSTRKTDYYCMLVSHGCS
jgi:hypothetical protein